MRIFKKSTAWTLVLCLVLSLALSVGPMTKTADAAGYDPYVFYFGPDSSLVPAYYRDYAKRFVGWSSHMLLEDSEGYQIVQMFNLTNVEEIQPTKPANFDQNKRYASMSAFCADLGVSYVYGAQYRALNLEESHFGKNADKVKHIRAIIRHSMPNIANAAVVQNAANAYFGKETVKGLTNAELASAVQAAVWYYANGASYGYYNQPYVWTADFSSSDNSYYWSDLEHCVSKADPLNVYETGTYNSQTNVNKVFQYLINLPGEDANDSIITKNALSLQRSAFTGNISNGNLTLFVDIDGIVDGDDELVLSAKCGDQTESVALGKNGVAATADGLFPITLTGVSAEDCAEVDLGLTGTQTVSDAVFFEAKPIGNSSARYSSQGFTGYGATGVPIEAETTVNPVVEVTSVGITKVDAKTGNPLSGVSFDLYMKQDSDDLKIGSYITDENGKISETVSNTEEYYFVETAPLKGYEPVSGNIVPGRVPNSWAAGSLEVTKKLINNTPAQPDETFNFKLTLDLSTAPLMDNGISWMTPDYLMGQLECSKNLTWSASGGLLTATFTLNADETVTVDSIPLGATYTLEEIQTDEDREWFTVTSKTDNSEAQQSNTVTGTVAAKNTVLFTNEVVTGELKLGELAVSKKLINETPAQVGETFNFRITLDLSTADAITNGAPWMTEEYLLEQITSDEDLTLTQKDGKYTATFTVDADETVTVKGIAQGTAYTVEEVLTAEDREWFTVASKVDDKNEKNSNTATGTVAAKNAILFTNTVVSSDVQLGDLNISKKLINETPAQVGETFHFRITLDFSTADAYTNAVPWMNDEYLLGQISCTEDLTWTKEDGKYTATFTVDADETVTVKGIAQGTAYTVEEILTAEDRAQFTVTSKVCNEETQNSTVAQGSIAAVNAVLFTNTVVSSDVQLGNLSVSKKLVNTTPAQVGETFHFQITLDLSTADVYTDPVFWMNDEYLMGFITCTEDLIWTKEEGKYTATFTVDADETVTVAGIAQGAAYTLEEILTEEERAWFTVTSKVGNDPAQNSTVAQGSIAEENAVLFTNSVVTTQVQQGSLEVSKELINTTPAVVGETFNFKVTLDLSTADVYEEEIPWMNDGYLMEQISSEEDLTWVQESGKYTADFTVNAGETVSIDGLAYGVTYCVEEVQTAEERERFIVTTSINDEEQKHSAVAQGAIARRNAVHFTNAVPTAELQTGSLDVSKKLINTTPAVVGETFHFQITLDLSTADIYTDPVFWMNDEYLLGFITCTEELTWTAEEGKYTATFTVDADETVTVEGIPQGTTYTVQEILTEEDREWFTVTSQIGDEAATDSDTVESTVAENNAVVFTNTVVTGPELKLGDPGVSKKLINTTPAEVRENFSFQITVDFSTADVYTDAAPWMNDEYLMSFVTGTEELTWTEKDGKYTATFTVNADETFTIAGIAYGTTYTVQEILTEEDREWFTVTCQIGDEDAIDSDTVESAVSENNDIVFTNTVVTGPELVTGNVEVSKKLVNTTPAKVDETFNFQITLDLSTADVYTDAAPWMNDVYLMSLITGTEELTWTEENGKYTATFTVAADETVTVEGIPQGTTYTVREILTEGTREWFTVTSQIGEEEAVNSDTAESTVAEKNAVIFTNSVVTTEVETGSLEITKKLLNASQAKAHEQFHFRLTLDLSQADVYQNPVFWMYDEYLLDQMESNRELTWTKSGEKKYTATFTLKADESITVDGIALGTGYTLEEVLSESDRKLYKVTTTVTADGGEAVEGKTSLIEGSVAQKNAVIFTNEYVEKIPVTDDIRLTVPLLLCLLSVMLTAVLMLNKRRFIG